MVYLALVSRNSAFGAKNSSFTFPSTKEYLSGNTKDQSPTPKGGEILGAAEYTESQ